MSFIYGSATIYQSATRFEQSFLCPAPSKLQSGLNNHHFTSSITNCITKFPDLFRPGPF
jgi:hypothetical protein